VELSDAEREIFVSEVSDKLEEFSSLLLKFENNSADQDLLNALFRAAHTVKGNASFVGLTNMVTAAHAIEDSFALMRDSKLVADKELIDLFFQGHALLSQIVKAFSSGEDALKFDGDALASAIKAKNSGKPTGTVQAAPVESLAKAPQEPIKVQVKDGHELLVIEVKLKDSAALPGMRAYLMRKKLTALAEIVREKPDVSAYENKDFNGLFGYVVQTKFSAPEIRSSLMNAEIESLAIRKYSPGAAKKAQTQPVTSAPISTESPPPQPVVAEPQKLEPNKPATPARTPQQPKDASELLKVPSKKIDDIINLVGELLSSNTVYAQINLALRREQGSREIYAQYRDNAEDMARIVTELQERILQVRMIPIETVFSRFMIVVRDYNSHQTEKAVKLAIEHGETEIDKTQIENLYEPLLHIIRNSMDHGIEARTVRLAMGKPAEGKIELRSYQEGNQIVIEIKDDGKGLDAEKIGQKAIERGLTTEAELLALTPQDIFSFIYMPGFSTAEKVTDISGRGVGMDVVKRKIEELHGFIQLQSEKGKGMTTRILLPLSLAIVTALRVDVRTSAFAIPITAILETIRIKPEDIFLVEHIETVNVRGKHVPVISVARELGVPEKNSSSTQTEHVVIVQVRQGRVGLRVDVLHGYEDMVIKSLSRNFEEVDGFSGAAILGRGNLCLILDPQKFVDLVMNAHSRQTLFGRHHIQAEMQQKNANDEMQVLEKIIDAAHANALRAIRQITQSQEVELRFREVKLRTLDSIMNDLQAQSKAGKHSVYFADFSSGISGLQYIVISENQKNLVARQMYGGETAASETESAMMELTNLVAVSFTNAVNLFSDRRVLPAAPKSLSSLDSLILELGRYAEGEIHEILTLDVDCETPSHEAMFTYSLVMLKETLLASLKPTVV